MLVLKLTSEGASRVALSSIAPVQLWEESGRLATATEVVLDHPIGLIRPAHTDVDSRSFSDSGTGRNEDICYLPPTRRS